MNRRHAVIAIERTIRWAPILALPLALTLALDFATWAVSALVLPVPIKLTIAMWGIAL